MEIGAIRSYGIQQIRQALENAPPRREGEAPALGMKEVYAQPAFAEFLRAAAALKRRERRYALQKYGLLAAGLAVSALFYWICWQLGGIRLWQGILGLVPLAAAAVAALILVRRRVSYRQFYRESALWLILALCGVPRAAYSDSLQLDYYRLRQIFGLEFDQMAISDCVKGMWEDMSAQMARLKLTRREERAVENGKGREEKKQQTVTVFHGYYAALAFTGQLPLALPEEGWLHLFPRREEGSGGPFHLEEMNRLYELEAAGPACGALVTPYLEETLLFFTRRFGLMDFYLDREGLGVLFYLPEESPYAKIAQTITTGGNYARTTMREMIFDPTLVSQQDLRFTHLCGACEKAALPGLLRGLVYRYFLRQENLAPWQQEERAGEIRSLEGYVEEASLMLDARESELNAEYDGILSRAGRASRELDARPRREE